MSMADVLDEALKPLALWFWLSCGIVVLAYPAPLHWIGSFAYLATVHPLMFLLVVGPGLIGSLASAPSLKGLASSIGFSGGLFVGARLWALLAAKAAR